MGRRYRSPKRDLGVEETRRKIVEAARDLLLAGGYRTMTVADLARTAGVSPQTVYNTVGGKAAVVKAVYDVLLAGDTAPVPMSERPEFLAMTEAPDRATMLAAYAAHSRRIMVGVGPLLAQLIYAGPASDRVIADLVSTMDAERRTGNTHMVTALRERHGLPDGTSLEDAVDVVWTLTSPEVADRLLRRCGWSAARYEQWLARSLQAILC
ncbi:TetR/AcrR family transcriptional regulator [Ornithinimicrobium cavernae]|uniref:TetR/AcrR family transcriptional regulator n=1 Tax=Ornithinimicrobium cavernae TaxID=2666047 RepID=UPI000D699496|nr:TetR/AcrR family transcriptional regulator [Ornithinimicrobium cavernae]